MTKSRRTESRPGAVERAYGAIKAGIIDGAWPPGAPLREVELSQQIGVSRTPVREALRRLLGDGLVTFEPHQGASVATWSQADLDEIFSLRAMIEAYAAEQAALRISAAEIAELAQLCAAMETALRLGGEDMLQRIATANSAFHGLIVSACDNRRLVSVLNLLVEVPLVMRTYHRYTTEELRRSLNHHSEIVAAFRAGDGAWAASVMRAHLLAGRAALRNGSQDPAPEL